MGLFKTNIDFHYIAERENLAKKRFENKEQIGKSINIEQFKKPLKYLYNTLISMKKNNSELKNYIVLLEKTGGDYIKRDSKIYNKVTLMYSFINDSILNSDPELKYSLAGVYKEAFDILTSPKYLNMFKTTFNIIQKKGELNTSLTIFKLIYISLVYMVEMSTLYLVDYELDIYNGVDKKTAMLNLMNTNSPFMKHVVVPIIDIIGFLNSIKNPVSLIMQINTEEIKANEKKSTENIIIINDENTGEESFLGVLTATVTTSTGLAISIPILVLLSLVVLFPLIRSIIYWAKIRKIDVGKEFELKAEILNNNIVLLKEKLDKTTDPNERERLIKIIEKQEAYVNKWRENARKRLGEDITTSYEVEDTINNEDSQQTDTSTDDEVIL